MTTSSIFSAITQLLVLANTALPTISIYDGPQVVYPTSSDFLIIGCDDAISTSMIAAIESGHQDWDGLGALAKDEFFDIYSTYVSWDGGNNNSLCRSRAQTNIAALETALRTNNGMTLNGALNQPGWCSIDITRLQQIQDSNGSALHVQFVVRCRSRI